MSLKEKLYEHLRENVYCKLGVSPIHGIGVFALRDIPKGAYPLKSMVSNKEVKFSRIELKKVPSTVRKHLNMFCLIEKGRVFAPEIGMNAVNLSIYLNHSKTPMSWGRWKTWPTRWRPSASGCSSRWASCSMPRAMPRRRWGW